MTGYKYSETEAMGLTVEDYEELFITKSLE